jgi:ATP-dependent DNA helicase 2 subunit 2
MEYMQLEDTFSPVLHRINAALRYRAAHPTKPIPPPAEVLIRYSHPPTELTRQAQGALAHLITTANVKKVPPKVKGRKRGRDVDKPLSGLDIGSLLGNEKRIKLSAENAIPEYKQLLATSEDPTIIRKASAQLGEIIETYVRHSVGDSGYGRAIEAIRIFKEEMIELEEPDVYNEWLRDFKSKVLGNGLGGDRKELWWLIRVHKLGLIHKGLSEVADVDEEEAKAVSSILLKRTCTLLTALKFMSGKWN